ncbi:heavy-metal-associated domain-containing protein [Flavihumibacter petaseus]|nr:heavy metal-associated domain-containing protein [Flavihumibacter petaseus]
METIQFKTTIKCAGCIAAVTPVLNKTVGENNWKVDTGDPSKILTIKAEDAAEATAVVSALESVGYKAEKLN